MKKNIFIAAFAAVAMLASCSKEQDSANNGSGDTKAAQIAITLEKPAAPTGRAFDPDAEDADQKVNDLIVFVVKGDGVRFDATPKYFAVTNPADPTAQVFTVNATTEAAQVYVVTNTGDYANGAFKNVANMNDVKAVTMKIDGNPNTTSNVMPGNVWMAGQTITGDATYGLLNDVDAVDGTPQKKALIKLNYIAAKVFVVAENHMTGTQENTKLSGAALINAGAYTGFVNNGTAVAPDYRVAREATGDTAQTPYYYNGISIDVTPTAYFDVPMYDTAVDFTNNITAYSNTVGFSTLTREPHDTATATVASTTLDDLTDANAFYVFPEADTNTKTWATLYGNYNEEGFAPEDTTLTKQAFWSVAWDGEDGVIADAVKSGYKYIITIELRGNNNSGGGYKDDPTVETLDQNINIKIEQAQWIPVSSKKIYE